MISAGIVGGTGYTGVELLRILALHPEVEVTVVTSRADTDKRVDTIYPNLRGLCDAVFTAPEVDSLAECDVVFFATPNGIAMKMADELLNRGVKIIDLSADFRLQNVSEWEHWYGLIHESPHLIRQAAYGLPEINREAIKKASLIACAGCYPTAVQLGFLPLIEKGLIDLKHLIADVKSGVSGAGRKAALSSLMSETGESFKAYAVAGHRHLPEIKQGLAKVVQRQLENGEAFSTAFGDEAGKPEIGLTFVPHLTPMIRGINATLYSQTDASLADIQSLFEQRYADENFVSVLPQGVAPDTRNVRGSNHCQLSVFKPQGENTLVVLSVIDNLVKGAAGQAVQCLNLMNGFDEDLGLKTIALYP
ncbi:MAG: N-acetyl-gamma-glutamyl-phosphate reductase [Methylococcaceae bacterium]|nr:N-acetyl-gamma-glutamyl-phosphate reductase [Methylococcaceae bacterium]